MMLNGNNRSGLRAAARHRTSEDKLEMRVAGGLFLNTRRECPDVRSVTAPRGGHANRV